MVGGWEGERGHDLGREEKETGGGETREVEKRGRKGRGSDLKER